MFGTTVFGHIQCYANFENDYKENYFSSPFWLPLILKSGMTLYNEEHCITFYSFHLQAFCVTTHPGVSGFCFRILWIFERSQLNEFSTDLQDSDL